MDEIIRRIVTGNVTTDELLELAKIRDIFVDFSEGKVWHIYHRDECIWEAGE